MKPDERRVGVRAVLLLVLIVGLVALVLAWRWTSLGGWLDIDQLVSQLRQAGGELGPLASVAYVALASMAAVPLGIIIVVSAIVFGPWLGGIFVLIGACLGGVVSYALGSYLGHEALCRFAGKRVNALSIRLQSRGVLAVVLLRMVPIAPFAIVNMIAGATHLRLLDFIVGTFIGMIPGVAIITILSDWMVGTPQ